MLNLAKLKSRYRVDNVPWFWKLPYWLLGYGLGFLSIAYYRLVHFTSTFPREGGEYVGPQGRPYLHSLWHENLPSFFCSFRNLSHEAWMSHPAWYMKPVFVVMEHCRIEVMKGSTGNDGREAANRIVEALKRGKSTTMAPDGPYGPFRQIKKGILHMAAQSGVPVVPTRYETRFYFMFDNKKFPLPFNRIRIVHAKPFKVTMENFEEATRYIEANM